MKLAANYGSLPPTKNIATPRRIRIRGKFTITGETRDTFEFADNTFRADADCACDFSLLLMMHDFWHSWLYPWCIGLDVVDITLRF